jgi:hypothetical protein
MEYMPAPQVAKKWGIWMISEDTEKSADRRQEENKKL